MPGRPFEATLRNQPGSVVIDLAGDIDASAEQKLDATCTAAEATNPTAILLNFLSVDYINSTGIALIVRLLTRSRQANRRLIAFGLSAHYADLFSITRLSDYIPIFPDESSALASSTATVQI